MFNHGRGKFGQRILSFPTLHYLIYIINLYKYILAHF